jgi:alkanesulfonate monooxygenase SsuD/methylene tetrahydromethanopterin reductase-like flavin-dependent oxidoreductase (luciferase family)
MNVRTSDDLTTVLGEAGPVGTGRRLSSRCSSARPATRAAPAAARRFRDGAGTAIPDALVDALWVHGTPEELREQLAAFTQHGISTVLVCVAPTPAPTARSSRPSPRSIPVRRCRSPARDSDAAATSPATWVVIGCT